MNFLVKNKSRPALQPRSHPPNENIAERMRFWILKGFERNRCRSWTYSTIEIFKVENKKSLPGEATWKANSGNQLALTTKFTEGISDVPEIYTTMEKQHYQLSGPVFSQFPLFYTDTQQFEVWQPKSWEGTVSPFSRHVRARRKGERVSVRTKEIGRTRPSHEHRGRCVTANSCCRRRRWFGTGSNDFPAVHVGRYMSCVRCKAHFSLAAPSPDTIFSSRDLGGGSTLFSEAGSR